MVHPGLVFAYKFLINSLCAIGFLIQAHHVSSDYFAFLVQTKIFIRFPEKIEPPYFSFCSRIAELSNLTQAKDLYNITSDGHQFQHDIMNNLTLQQMFDIIPSAEEVLEKCYYRFPN